MIIFSFSYGEVTQMVFKFSCSQLKFLYIYHLFQSCYLLFLFYLNTLTIFVKDGEILGS
jgi:hypothetical protein